MATQVLTDPKIYAGQYDLSGDHSSVAATYSAELLDVTAFGASTRTRKGGLKLITFSGEGFWSGGDDLVDDALFGKIGLADQVITLAPEGETLGNVAYLFRANAGQYQFGGAVGEMLRFSVSAEGSGGAPVARGELLHVGAETATGTETGSQVGAVAAGQSIYAALHVLTVAGSSPTLDVVLQSDDNGSFSSATDRITFTQATGITSEWKSLAGAITDDYWRASFTIGGTGSPSFEFILAVGII